MILIFWTPTKLVPEELVPLIPIGKMTLNRNPDNFFAETEQVAFCISHVVPGIDFTNDPLLQARLFSYPDTQLKRLGSPNFHEIPINKSVAPVVNNQRDGHMRQTINPGQAAYFPNTTGGGCPFQAGMKQGGFDSFAAKMEGVKIRARAESFFDHFSQASLFYNSQNDVEKSHIIQAFQFELAHCETPAIRERVIGVLEQVDKGLAKAVAEGLGITLPAHVDQPLNQLMPADADVDQYQPTKNIGKSKSSAALSIINNLIPGCATRKIAFLVTDGFDAATVDPVKKTLEAAGAMVKIMAQVGGEIADNKGQKVPVDFTFHAAGSVLFDAVYVAGGKNTDSLKKLAPAVLFINESYKHLKAIAGANEGADFVKFALTKAGLNVEKEADSICTAKNGVVLTQAGTNKNISALADSFKETVSLHRVWDRVKANDIAV